LPKHANYDLVMFYVNVCGIIIKSIDEAKTTYSSGAPEFTPGVLVRQVLRIL